MSLLNNSPADITIIMVAIKGIKNISPSISDGPDPLIQRISRGLHPACLACPVSARRACQDVHCQTGGQQGLPQGNLFCYSRNFLISYVYLKRPKINF